MSRKKICVVELVHLAQPAHGLQEEVGGKDGREDREGGGKGGGKCGRNGFEVLGLSLTSP